MTAHGYHRGHHMTFIVDESHEDGGVWTYDDGTPVPEDPDRPCGFCGLPNREDGHDACLGELPDVWAACCGHGNPKEAYVTIRLAGEDAMAVFRETRGENLRRGKVRDVIAMLNEDP